MAIQVRRGLKADFDPTKMLPGEWAVSIDSDTNAQIVWMCFAAGVVKRMGTYEDFKSQIAEATSDIREEYLSEFQVILNQIEALAEQTNTNTNTVVTIRDDFLNIYLPQINEYLNGTYENAERAKDSKEKASDFADLSKSYAVGTGGTVRENDGMDNAKYYSEQALNYKDYAKIYAESAKDSVSEISKKIELATFDVDDNGNLIYTDNSSYSFVVDNNGYLNWEVI